MSNDPMSAEDLIYNIAYYLPIEILSRVVEDAKNIDILTVSSTLNAAADRVCEECKTNYPGYACHDKKACVRRSIILSPISAEANNGHID